MSKWLKLLLIQRAMKYPKAIEELKSVGLVEGRPEVDKLLLTMKRDFDE